MPNDQQRFDELETRLAHQEKTIGELGEMVTAQWRKIEDLQRQLRQMNDELQSIDTAANVVDRPPPHY